MSNKLSVAERVRVRKRLIEKENNFQHISVHMCVVRIKSYMNFVIEFPECDSNCVWRCMCVCACTSEMSDCVSTSSSSSSATLLRAAQSNYLCVELYTHYVNMHIHIVSGIIANMKIINMFIRSFVFVLPFPVLIA